MDMELTRAADGEQQRMPDGEALEYLRKDGTELKRQVIANMEIAKIQMAKSIADNLDLGVIRWFKEQKDSKLWKNTTYVTPDGKTFQPGTFAELCEGMGFNKTEVYEKLNDFAVFGLETMQRVQTLGLSRTDIRRLRVALKDAGQDKTDDVVLALSNSDPDGVGKALDALCERNAQLAESNKRLRGDMAARDQVNSRKQKRIAELEDKLDSLTCTTPDAQTAARVERRAASKRKLASAAADALLGFSKFLALTEAMLKEATPDDEADIASGVADVTGRLCGDIAGEISQRGVDIDFAAYFSDVAAGHLLADALSGTAANS